MRANDTDQRNELESEIKKRFSEFNGGSLPSKGRRYPEELKELIRRAGSEGMKTAELSRLSGLSDSAVNRYRGKAVAKVVAPRRLEVIKEARAEVIIRLMSGVTIEVSDLRVLSSELLSTLSLLEVSHATAR